MWRNLPRGITCHAAYPAMRRNLVELRICHLDKDAIPHVVCNPLPLKTLFLPHGRHALPAQFGTRINAPLRCAISQQYNNVLVIHRHKAALELLAQGKTHTQPRTHSKHKIKLPRLTNTQQKKKITKQNAIRIPVSPRDNPPSTPPPQFAKTKRK